MSRSAGPATPPKAGFFVQASLMRGRSAGCREQGLCGILRELLGAYPPNEGFGIVFASYGQKWCLPLFQKRAVKRYCGRPGRGLAASCDKTAHMGNHHMKNQASRLVCKAIMVLSILLMAKVALAMPPVRVLEAVTDHRQNEMLPMRDGIRLWTSIHFPKGMAAQAPAILIRTPYAFEMESTLARGMLADFAAAGYIIIFQNERGRFWSEGTFSIIPNSAKDGYDTIDWIARQPWSNGRVGTFGCSSSGDSQVKLATRRHPAHRAAVSMSSGSAAGVLGDFHEQGAFYRGGVPQVPWWTWYASAGQSDFPKFPAGISRENRDWIAHSLRDWLAKPDATYNVDELIRHLPSMDVVRAVHGQATEYEKFIRRLPNDPAWQKENFLNEGDSYEVPTLWVFQAFDIGLSPNVAMFEYAHQKARQQEIRGNQYMLISALGHCSMLRETADTINGERALGDARYPYRETFMRWFDHWLKDAGDGGLNKPRAEIYVSGRNQWRQFAAWPSQDSRKIAYYLGSSGRANTREGDGFLATAAAKDNQSDSYVYDPRYPVPSVGGDVCCVGRDYQPGSFDQSEVELRHDVLVYTSEPLTEDAEVIGFVDVILHVASDAPDTDFTAKLVDVYPDGRAYNVGDSIQRARWRNGYKAPDMMKKGDVYELRIGPFFVANRFNAGHRLRLDITSSNFPRYERNLNTGGNNFDEKAGQAAQNEIHHGPRYPSRLLLPVLVTAGD